MRKAEIFMLGRKAGRLSELEDGYVFEYDPEYKESENAVPICLEMPLSKSVYEDRYLFPFFDGLIPEGWLLDIAEETWKLNPRDRFGLLLACCKDCIGAVSVREVAA